VGNWTIVIEGTGGHHNNHECDADVLLKSFAEKLRDSAQTVEHVSFTNGARDIMEREG